VRGTSLLWKNKGLDELMGKDPGLKMFWNGPNEGVDMTGLGEDGMKTQKA
jgi:hypothetical protein